MFNCPKGGRSPDYSLQHLITCRTPDLASKKPYTFDFYVMRYQALLLHVLGAEDNVIFDQKCPKQCIEWPLDGMQCM